MPHNFRDVGGMSLKALTEQGMAQCSLGEEYTWNLADVEESIEVNGHHKAGMENRNVISDLPGNFMEIKVLNPRQ